MYYSKYNYSLIGQSGSGKNWTEQWRFYFTNNAE